MKRILCVIVSLAGAASLASAVVSFSDESGLVHFREPHTHGGRSVMHAATENGPPIRSSSADLDVTKVCEPSEAVAIRQQSTCTIVVRNLGPDPAFNIKITDKLISTGAFTVGAVTTSAGSCTDTSTDPHDSGTVTCIASSMAWEATITITVPLSANTPQNIYDVASAKGQPFDPIPQNNSADSAVHVIANER